MQYRIIRFIKEHGNATVEFNGQRINCIIPITEGQYPVGAELDRIIAGYIKQLRERSKNLSAVEGNKFSYALSRARNAKSPLKAQAFICRRRLMSAVRFYLTPDFGLTEAEFIAWKSYSDALRQVPMRPNYPNIIIWPIPPWLVVDSNGTVLTNAQGVPMLI